MEWRKFRNRLALLHPSRRAWPPSQCLALRHCFSILFSVNFIPLSLSPTGGDKIACHRSLKPRLRFGTLRTFLSARTRQIRSNIRGRYSWKKRGLFELVARTVTASNTLLRDEFPREASFLLPISSVRE